MEQTGDSMLSMLPRPQALGEVGHEEDWSWEDIYEALSLYQVLDGGNKEFGYLIGRLQSQRDEEKHQFKQEGRNVQKRNATNVLVREEQSGVRTRVEGASRNMRIETLIEL